MCVGVYPEAMAWNIGVVCSDFILGECILGESTLRPNLKGHFEIGPLVALSPDTLTKPKIWAHSANVPIHCRRIDTPHAYVKTL